jgi:hypothetical protein
MSGLDEVGRQGVPGYKHLRPALGESVEPGRRRTLMGGTAGRRSARDGCHQRSQSRTRGGAGLLVCRSAMPPDLSAVSWTASAVRSSSLMSATRGSPRAADLVDLLGRSIDRAPSFACGSAVFAAAQRFAPSRAARTAMASPMFRGVKGNRVLVADLAWGHRTMTIDQFQAVA